ncbi:MAG: outer membrane lipoprotein-sorting protein [Pseudomonadales bacterium]|nr:outer membrane lipoprotein-sorting protein [Pseudomonadales bacterium]
MRRSRSSHPIDVRDVLLWALLVVGAALSSPMRVAAAQSADEPEVRKPDVQEPGVREPGARELVAGALDLIRGRTSYMEMSMLVHRPEWERSSSLVSWTRGREDALIRFTAPARDAGNATLKQGDKMWTYTPKLNRTIRLPYSLMSQSWAGSDFSYNDLSKTDDMLRYYDLSIADSVEQDGHRIYTIEAIPHDDSPVVWGKEQLVLRDDYVLISQTFYDQAMVPLKRLETLEIAELGGRTMSVRMRMIQLDEVDHYTEVSYDAAQFDIALEDRTFTVYALQSGAAP